MKAKNNILDLPFSDSYYEEVLNRCMALPTMEDILLENHKQTEEMEGYNSLDDFPYEKEEDSGEREEEFFCFGGWN